VPVREEDAGLYQGRLYRHAQPLFDSDHLTRVRDVAPKVHDDIEALDAAYAEIHRCNPFLEVRDFVALVRDLVDRPDFKETLDLN
jgi:hypothetical protein